MSPEINFDGEAGRKEDSQPLEARLDWGTAPRAAVHAANGYTLYKLYGQGSDALLGPALRASAPQAAWELRLAKSIAGDIPVAWLESMATHEAGHFEWAYMGGAKKVSWVPYDGYSVSGRVSLAVWGDRQPTPAQWQGFVAGGLQATQTAADEMRRVLLSQDRADWTSLVMFTAHKTDITGYAFLSPSPERAGPLDAGNDIVVYSKSYGGRSGRSPASVYSSILKGAAWNALDPLNFWALANYFGAYVARGRENFANPMLKLGGAQGMLGTGFWLSETGPQYMLPVLLRDPKTGSLLQLTPSLGDDGQFSLAAYLAALRVADFLKASAGLGLWYQRESAEPGPKQVGGSVKGGLEVNASKSVSLGVEAGCKSSGAMLGQPSSAGPFLMGSVSASF